MSQIDVLAAKKALAYLLREWGVADNPTAKAHGFIDDLCARGWAMDARAESRPRPPRRDEACPVCNRHRDQCGDPEHQPKPPAPDPTAHVARIRAELRGMRDE